MKRLPVSRAVRREQSRLRRIGLQGDAMALRVCFDNPRIDEDLALFRDALEKDDELLSERLNLLADKLREGTAVIGVNRRFV